MAFLGDVTRDAHAENLRYRMVREHIPALNVKKYWARASFNNFLINGGSESERSYLLCEAVTTIHQNFDGPIIVLNGSMGFEAELIRRVQNAEIGHLFVASARTKGYDLFSGMSWSEVKAVFFELGQLYGLTNLMQVMNYTEAFLKILTTQYRPTLHAITAFAKRSDEEIRAIGRSQHVAESVIQSITGNFDAGAAFRQLVSILITTFDNIQYADETGYSLFNLSQQQAVHCITPYSQQRDVVDAVLSYELNSLIARGITFVLILNDYPIRQGDKLFLDIQTMRDTGSTRVGICTANAAALAEGLLMRNFPSILLLNTASIAPQDLENILKCFGTYKKQFVAGGVHADKRLIDIIGLGAPEKHSAHQDNLRVELYDMNRYSVAACGHDGLYVGLYPGYK